MARGKYQNSTHIARAPSRTHTRTQFGEMFHSVVHFRVRAPQDGLVCLDFERLLRCSLLVAFEYCTIPAYLPLSHFSSFFIICFGVFLRQLDLCERFSNISCSRGTWNWKNEIQKGEGDGEREREQPKDTNRDSKVRYTQTIFQRQLRCQTLKIIISVLCFKIKWKRFSVCGHTLASHPDQMHFS